MAKKPEFLLALDVSTSTIGIALFEDLGDKGKLAFLSHVSPKVKPQPENKMEELFRKVIDDFKAQPKNKRSLWDTIFPYKLLIIKKEKNRG